MRLAITGRLEQWPEQKPFDKRKHVPLQFIEISDTLGVTLIPALSPEKTADDIAGICDGLILSGTLNDIHPSYYGEEPAPGLKYEIDEYAGDRSLILAFSAENKPILGICGGLQSINVTFGGTLHQHIDGHFLNDRGHRATVSDGSFLAEVYGAGEISVNSSHHQVVKDKAPGFAVTAVSSDGIIEAIERDNIIGVQWHPEAAMDMDFFRAFVDRFIVKK